MNLYMSWTLCKVGPPSLDEHQHLTRGIMLARSRLFLQEPKWVVRPSLTINHQSSSTNNT
jgi:hypothetical protein